ncbi:MAG: hypothetical protein KAG94_01925 [Clostridiales bacterium]|nr:hypothetical protein [Clostridiales bacterium]
MLLSALIDFPDDAAKIYSESTMNKMLEKLKETGVSRVYFQYYGNRDYGHFWDHKAPSHRETVETANNIPEFSQVFVKAAKANGIEPVAVMRPQEQGIWFTFSPYYKEARGNNGIQYTGGKIMIVSKFLLENPHLRIKRRTWDIDKDAINKKICMIKLYKQNNIHSRITKQNITIYVSNDNANYNKYEGDFTLTYSTEKAKSDVITSGFIINYPIKTITNLGDSIEVITLGELSINERYVAIAVNCKDKVNDEELFINTPMHAISIFDENKNEICASPGSANWKTPTNEPHLQAGFNFDDGFGENWPVILDSNDKEEYLAICKGKDEYVHGALCVCEPKVQEYWLKWLDKALDDGYEMVGNRIECHSVHVDEPFAYGYNDCIKEEYFRRFGKCGEKDMELSKISKIRGDAYTKLFIEGAKRVRARGKKVYLTLNVEMLYDPIPIARHMAYPMNVEWQWKRWIDKIQPDEINIRAYYSSLDFILNDPQCKKFVETAKKYNVPLTLERYDYWDFATEFETVRDSGDFSRMTLYEVNNIIQSDGKGGIVEIKPELLAKLKTLIK